MVKIGFIFGLLGLLLLANTCSAAVELDVPVDTKEAAPGTIVRYDLVVSLGEEPDDTVPYPITEFFSIEEDDENAGWLYSFSRESVILDLERTTNSSVLEITVPGNAEIGKTYSHTVIATGYDSLGDELGIPIELDVHVVNTNVNEIPEFPSIALPVAAVLGLVFVFGRRKE
ncbi:MAG: PEF-CTERM sorting domain-containing protein [Euryarchaeota archaeon]|nr:PEF-CTERM sorting domain-containing protein [Euryarchaeota archaeon]